MAFTLTCSCLLHGDELTHDERIAVGLVLARKPAAAESADELHFTKLECDTKYLLIHVFVPMSWMAAYQTTAAGEPTYRWLDERLRSQDSVRSRYDRGLLVLYGIGVKQDVAIAAQLMAAGPRQGWLDGPRQLIWLATAKGAPIEHTRAAVPLLQQVLIMQDWWCVWGACQAWDQLNASSDEADHALARGLMDTVANVLVHSLLPQERSGEKPDPLRSQLLGNADAWCYRLLCSGYPLAYRQVKAITSAWLRSDGRDLRAQLRRIDALYRLGENAEVVSLALKMGRETGFTPAEQRSIDNLRVSSALLSHRLDAITAEDIRRVVYFPGGMIAVALSAVLFLALPFLTFYLSKVHQPWWLALLWPLWMMIAASSVYLPWGAAVLMAVIALAMVLFAQRRGRAWNYFQPPVVSIVACMKMILLCVLLVAVYQAICFSYAWVYELTMGEPVRRDVLNTLLKPDTLGDWLCALIVVGVCCPVGEEIVFRGFLLDLFSRWMRPALAALMSAVVFGVGHGWSLALPVMGFGLLATWLRFHYQSLVPGIFLHCLTNSLLVTLRFLDVS